MIKNIFSSFWFWGIILVAFITIILWDDSIEEGAKGSYKKHKMTLNNVNFSQIDNGFEHARMYATTCEMDDSQTNMEARDIKVLFFKEDVATFTGKLVAASATKTPFEAKFYGDVRLWDTDNERMRTEEMRYLFNRKELSTQRPITVWKDNAVLTGLGMTYNTERKEITVNQQVVIRLWEEKKEKETKPLTDKDPISGLPVAAPIENILDNLNASTSKTQDVNDSTASETQDVNNLIASGPQDINNSIASKTQDVNSSTASKTQDVNNLIASETKDVNSSIASETKDVKNSIASETQDINSSTASKTQHSKTNLYFQESYK